MGRLFTQYGVSYGRTGLAPAGQTIYDTVARLVRPYPFNMTVIGAREIDHPTTQAGEGLLFRSIHLTAAQKAQVLADLQRALYVAPRRFRVILAREGARNEAFEATIRPGLTGLTAYDLRDI